MVELWSNHKKKQDYIIDIQNIQLDFQNVSSLVFVLKWLPRRRTNKEAILCIYTNYLYIVSNFF